jgi:uncharacterized membrane protein YraQ (UPF0718 family)
VENQVKDLIVCFTSIFYEALPFIILGSIIAGILEHAVPQHWITRLVPRWRPAAIALGCLLGLIFPMCECGIVPVMRRLLRKGLPLSCCTAYMMAGPVINPIVILSTFVAFSAYDGGLMMVGLRIGMAFVIAFATSVFIDMQAARYGSDLLVPAARPDAAGHDANNNSNMSFRQKIGAITETAIHDFVDITVFLTLGALLSALSRMFFTHDQIDSLSTTYPIMSILAMIGLAIVLCLCSEADAFVAASFSTLAPAPKLAFLVLGPMLDIKLFLLFTRVFRGRVIATIVAGVVIQTFVYCLIVHFTAPTWIGRAVQYP